MLTTPMAYRGMLSAPHHLAALAGRDVLRDGGNAIEAMVAAAATIAVVYPHMNSIGGDGFWLLHHPEREPIGIDACGAAAGAATLDFYAGHGAAEIPARGPLAANTVAGTLSGWTAALAVAKDWGGQLPLERLLEPAIHHARHGVAVTASQHALTAQKRAELLDVPGFKAQFLRDGAPPRPGELFLQPRLADTLQHLSDRGLEDFYRGELARAVADDLAKVGSPLTLSDLEQQEARMVEPLHVRLREGLVFNLPPPTQGVASLLILAIAERCGLNVANGIEYIHGLVESTKQAFLVRDRYVEDPDRMSEPAEGFLRPHAVAELAAAVDLDTAMPWVHPGASGDTVWMGAIDDTGRAVSFIQSAYWEFGSGIVLEQSGIQWQNRGASFKLATQGVNALEPGRRPFHTLNPALALLDDGRTMVYGTMGGEGQPQTQAAVYTRYVHQRQPLQAAITAPRWLLGRTWGEASTTLKLESRFDDETVEGLRALGHPVELVGEYDACVGHAGAVVHHADGLLEGATDPRSEGAVASW